MGSPEISGIESFVRQYQPYSLTVEKFVEEIPFPLLQVVEPLPETKRGMVVAYLARQPEFVVTEFFKVIQVSDKSRKLTEEISDAQVRYMVDKLGLSPDLASQFSFTTSNQRGEVLDRLASYLLGKSEAFADAFLRTIPLSPMYRLLARAVYAEREKIKQASFKPHLV